LNKLKKRKAPNANLKEALNKKSKNPFGFFTTEEQEAIKQGPSQRIKQNEQIIKEKTPDISDKKYGHDILYKVVNLSKSQHKKYG